MRRLLIGFVLMIVGGMLSQVVGRPFKIQGNVYDESHKPMQYVHVLLKATSQGTVTDEKGGFSYECEVDGDTVSVIFSYVEFETKEMNFTPNSKTTGLVVVMKEKNIELSTFELNAIRKQTNSSDSIDISKVKVMPSASGGGIETLISMQAGVSMKNELSSQYSVRGGNYDENSVYVNSIEVYRPMLIRSAEQEGLSFVNPDMVKSVSFSSGGFSVEYGDKMSSVLDIQYKKPTHFEGSASISLLGATAYVGHSTSKFSQMHGFRYKTSSYMLGALKDASATYDPNYIDYQTYLTCDFSKEWKLSFLGNLSRNEYLYRPDSSSTCFGTSDTPKELKTYFEGQEDDLFLTCFGALTLSYEPSVKTKLELSSSSYIASEKIGYDITGDYLIGDAIFSDNQRKIANVEGVGGYHEHARNQLGMKVTNISFASTHKLPFNQLKWRVTYQRERIDDVVSEWNLIDSAGYSLPTNNSRIVMSENLSSDVDLESNRLMGYIQDSYVRNYLKGKLTLVGGVRLSYWDFNKELLVSPRFSLAWFPEKYPNWGIRLATGIYYQSLMYKEFREIVKDEYDNSTVSLNDKVKSPRSFQLLLASDYYFKIKQRPFKFSTELYGKYIDRIIPYSVDNSQIVYKGRNCADGFVVGADFKLFGEIVPGTDSWVSLSLMKTKENIYGDDVSYIDRPMDQVYNISFFYQDYFPGYDKLKFNLKFIWADGFPFGPPNSDKYKSYFRMNDYRRVDIGAVFLLRNGVDKVMDKKIFSWMKTLSLNLDVFNLLGIYNVSSYNYVKVVSGAQYAVPNHLTGRRINFKIQVDF
ncbi:MAG: TonB-dependent receptor [Paludibacteraceae bacterium]|nr:TonB-dependent receptor [Paludibacteraceae bacterium]